MIHIILCYAWFLCCKRVVYQGLGNIVMDQAYFMIVILQFYHLCCLYFGFLYFLLFKIGIKKLNLQYCQVGANYYQIMYHNHYNFDCFINHYHYQHGNLNSNAIIYVDDDGLMALPHIDYFLSYIYKLFQVLQ